MIFNFIEKCLEVTEILKYVDKKKANVINFLVIKTIIYVFIQKCINKNIEISKKMYKWHSFKSFIGRVSEMFVSFSMDSIWCNEAFS